MKIDESKLTQALRAERERKRKGRDEEEEWGGKKKKAGDSHEVTEEELGKLHFTFCTRRVLTVIAEAYRMNRRMTEDPMANYVDEEL